MSLSVVLLLVSIELHIKVALSTHQILFNALEIFTLEPLINKGRVCISD